MNIEVNIEMNVEGNRGERKGEERNESQCIRARDSNSTTYTTLGSFHNTYLLSVAFMVRESRLVKSFTAGGIETQTDGGGG